MGSRTRMQRNIAKIAKTGTERSMRNRRGAIAVNWALVMSLPCVNAVCRDRRGCPRAFSGVEILRVSFLDFVDLRLDGLRIVLHQLDILERHPPRLLLGQGMGGAERADIDDELL